MLDGLISITFNRHEVSSAADPDDARAQRAVLLIASCIWSELVADVQSIFRSDQPGKART